MWGYREVRTPIFEYLDVLSKKVGKDLVHSMFKAQDDDGKLVAFRAEMTAPVARLVCSKMIGELMPLRLCYISNVVRFKEGFRSYPREFWQAGVELIGYRGVDADAEVISLMISSLNELGLKEVKIDIGHAGIFKRLLSLADLNVEESEMVKNLVSMKDSTGLKGLLRRVGCRAEVMKVFEAICDRRGLGVLDEVLCILSDDQLVRQANEILLLFELLKYNGVQDKVTLDLSLIRGFDYYTGIIFEPYTPTFGRALGGGGRYDDLIATFTGKEVPATGFALVVDYLVEAIGVDSIIQRISKRKSVIIVPANLKSYGKAMARARSLRGQGVIVELHPVGDIKGAQARAERIGANLEVVE